MMTPSLFCFRLLESGCGDGIEVSQSPDVFILFRLFVQDIEIIFINSEVILVSVGSSVLGAVQEIIAYANVQ